MMTRAEFKKILTLEGIGDRYMKKILPIVVALILVAVMTPLVCSDTTDITGSFDPSTSMSASLTNSTMNWSTLSASATATNNTQLNNDGDVNIDVSIQEQTEATSLYHSTNASASTNEYLLEFNMEGGGLTDITRTDGAPETLEDNVPASGQANNYTNFDVKITMGSDFTGEFGWQQSVIRVTYTEHT